jgi:O-antigen ligase
MERTALKVFVGHPILGVGPHNFSTYVDAVSRNIVGSADIYSRTLGELGAVGFLGFCFLMVRIGTAIAAGVRSAPENSVRRSLQLGILLGFLSNAVDFLFFGLIFPFPWLLYFVGVASARVSALAGDREPRVSGQPSMSAPQVAAGG